MVSSFISVISVDGACCEQIGLTDILLKEGTLCNEAATCAVFGS